MRRRALPCAATARCAPFATGSLTHERDGKRDPGSLEDARVHGHPSEFAGHQRRTIGAALAAGIFDDVAEQSKHCRIAEASRSELPACVADGIIEQATRHGPPAPQCVDECSVEAAVRARGEARGSAMSMNRHTLMIASARRRRHRSRG